MKEPFRNRRSPARPEGRERGRSASREKRTGERDGKI
jgi:hypothetical protein